MSCFTLDKWAREMRQATPFQETSMFGSHEHLFSKNVIKRSNKSVAWLQLYACFDFYIYIYGAKNILFMLDSGTDMRTVQASNPDLKFMVLAPTPDLYLFRNLDFLAMAQFENYQVPNPGNNLKKLKSEPPLFLKLESSPRFCPGV